MTLAELTAQIKSNYESELAYGSETAIWGDYCEDARQQTGALPYGDDAADVDAPQDFADYWLATYKYYAETIDDESVDAADVLAQHG